MRVFKYSTIYNPVLYYMYYTLRYPFKLQIDYVQRKKGFYNGKTYSCSFLANNAETDAGNSINNKYLINNASAEYVKYLL